MSYRPQLKTSGGMIDFPLDAETIKGKTLLEQTYPIGSIYLSVDNTSPASLFGGTWEKLKDKFLLGDGDTYSNGATGGSASHSHRLDNGFAKIGLRGSPTSLVYREKSLQNTDVWQNQYNIGINSFTENTNNINYATELGGSTNSANNMPPYLVVYMWKRTA